MTERAAPSDAGCWVDGHWGQYAAARLIEIAAELGWTDDAVAAATRDLQFMGPHVVDDTRTDEEMAADADAVSWAMDDVEAWLNEHVAPAGYYFGWEDGEFFLSPNEETECAQIMAASGLEALYWGTYRGEESEAWNQGDDVNMSDLVTADDFVSQRLEGSDAVVAFYRVPVTLWGDYVGSAVERSNHRVLMEEHPELYSDFRGFPGAHELLIPARPVDIDVETLRDIVATAVKLRDEYPLVDEEDHSRLETELAEEAWDCYLRMDVVSDLNRRGVDTDKLEDATLREMFYDITSMADESPYAESADSVVFPCYASTIDELVRRLAPPVMLKFPGFPPIRGVGEPITEVRAEPWCNHDHAAVVADPIGSDTGVCECGARVRFNGVRWEVQS